MGQNFIPDTVNQTLLFPPSHHEWLPEGHLARFVLDVVSALDLSAIYTSHQEKDGRGQAAYAPEMMVRLLLYGYAKGVYNSRKMQARTFEDLAFRYLSGDQHPDHATIAEFRNFLDTIEKNVPEELDVHLIMDNYGPHKTKLIHNWLAKRPRFHVHFTPTSASWLNLVERWFALLTERQLRRGVHRSTKELKAAINDFIQHHNREPKPFIWHKNRRPDPRFCREVL